MKTVEMSKIIPAILTVFSMSSALAAEPERPRGFATYYQQRLYLADDLPRAEGAPSLGSHARFHGAEVEGFISENIIFGLYGNGILSRKRTDAGTAEWGGGVAALFGQYRVYPGHGTFVSAGLGLGCGRVSYTAAQSEGTNVQSVAADAFFAEPQVNVGYAYHRKLHAKLQASYMFSGLGNTYAYGSSQLAWPFPRGFSVGLSIGYRFPFFE